MGWWSLGKLSNEMCRTYLLKCKRCFKTLLQNYDAVVEAERAAQLQDHQVAVGHSRSQLRLFPKLTNLLEHFQYAQDRYMMYALQGPPQAAKTSFVKSLFSETVRGDIAGRRHTRLAGL